MGRGSSLHVGSIPFFPGLSALLWVMGLGFVGQMLLGGGFDPSRGGFLDLGPIPGLVCWACGADGRDAVFRNLELERLFAHMFLHASVVHLLMNALALYNLGRIVEPIYGTTRFVLVFLISGVAGSLASNAWGVLQGEATFSVGASGAVLGLVGLLLGHLWGRTDAPSIYYRRSLIQWALIILIFGLVHPRVNNAAHVGGFVAGYLLSRVLPVTSLQALSPGWERRLVPRISGLVMVAALAAVTWAALRAPARYDFISAYVNLERRIRAAAMDLVDGRSEAQVARALRQAHAPGELESYKTGAIGVLDAEVPNMLEMAGILYRLRGRVGSRVAPDLFPVEPGHDD